MAKVTGLNNLKVVMRGIPIEVFKTKVRKFVEAFNSFKALFIKVQQAKLVNPYINDNRTDFPHIRTGNLMRNLIDVKMERYKESNFKQSGNILSYEFETTNRMDYSKVYKVGKNGSKVYYAKDLNTGKNTSKRYMGYFGRLQQVFRTNFNSKYRELSKLI
jgi:hypothetical protein